MGLNTKIYHEILKKYFASSLRNNLWGRHAIFDDEAAAGIVYVADLLTQMRNMRKWLPDEGVVQVGFTGEQLAKLYIEAINKVLVSGIIHTYVGVVDIQSMVPQEKFAEQKKRSKASAIVPYGTDCLFTDAGIIDGYQEKCALLRARGLEPTAANLAPFAELIETERVFTNRRLRTELYTYFCNYFYRHPYSFMKGARVIIDAQEGNFFTVKDGNAQYVPFKRDFGEADLQMMVWVHHYCWRHAIWLQSIDRDLIAIIISYLFRQSRRLKKGEVRHEPKRITCWQDFQKGFDMTHMISEMTDHHAWHPMHFIVACILCGTDFVPKDSLTNKIGVHMIFWAVLGPGRDLVRNILDPAVGPAQLQLVLQAIYTEQYDESKNMVGYHTQDAWAHDQLGKIKQLQERRARRRASYAESVKNSKEKRVTAGLQQRPKDYKPLDPLTLYKIAQKRRAKVMRMPEPVDIERIHPSVAFNIQYWMPRLYKESSAINVPE
jgi:hypothetical protein